MHPLRSFGMLWPLRMIRPLHPLDFFHFLHAVLMLYAVLMEISDQLVSSMFRGADHRAELKAQILRNLAPAFFICPKGIQLL